MQPSSVHVDMLWHHVATVDIQLQVPGKEWQSYKNCWSHVLTPNHLASAMGNTQNSNHFSREKI
jgi:hypothetical protein